MLNDGQGLILDKKNVSGGSVEQLRTWLQDKSGKQLEWMELPAQKKK